MLEEQSVKLLIADDNKEFCNLVVEFSKVKRISKLLA